MFLLALALAFGIGLNGWGPLESSEARYAEIGREMLTTHDWLHPRLLGIQHFHKPPLTYWLTAAGLSLLGPTAAGVRALPVAAVLLQVWLMYGLGLMFFSGNRRLAVAAAVVYGTLPVVLISALNVTTDAYLATLELAAAYGLLRYYTAGRRWGLYLAWLGLGLAFLTKGPVGFVLPLMAVLGFYFRRKEARRPLTVHHLLGIGLFLVVGLSWYLFLMNENPAFLRYFLVGHTVERFANAEAFGRAKPWWFYVVLAPATSLPWSALLIARAVRTPWRRLPQLWRNVLVFGVLVPLVFFSLSQSKLLLYVLPIFPGVALLTVYYASQLSEAALRRWYLGLLVFWGAILGTLLVAPAVVERFGLVLGASAAVVPGIGLGALLLSAWASRQAGPLPRLLLASALFTCFFLLSAKPILHQNELAFNGTRAVAQALRAQGRAGRPILVYNELLPSLAFELGQVPVSLYAGNHNLVRETQFESSRRWQQTLIDLHAAGPRPVLDSLLRQRPMLLVKGEVNPDDEWLLQGLPNQEQVGPWRIYSAW